MAEWLGYALKAGSKIGASHPFSGRIMVSYSVGQWINVNDRYLGLKFQSKGKPHFGWARLNVQVSNAVITATLTGYAYETIPNKPIITGKTHGKDVVTVQPASLGALAAGANGLHIWR